VDIGGRISAVPLVFGAMGLMMMVGGGKSAVWGVGLVAGFGFRSCCLGESFAGGGANSSRDEGRGLVNEDNSRRIRGKMLGERLMRPERAERARAISHLRLGRAVL